jgi:hypothetical protein
MPNKTQLGDKPIEPAFKDRMNAVAHALDHMFNSGNKGKERKTGFVLMIFPFCADKAVAQDHQKEHRCNYISNAERSTVIELLKEQIKYFEAQNNG